ncbi:MAG: hypothetical protein KDI90_04760 [Alphaproteobacteria bacterium]|nr:hypothetical protein [Alphaproteobacteria bacterium]MCB9974360.1 hypothetical protein [Rhodospirillales bacterium]
MLLRIVRLLNKNDDAVTIMIAGQAFKTEEDIDVPDLEGMEDFLEYMDSPRAIGLDGMKAELRHMILLMMELQGHNTGYKSQQMLGLGHTSLIMNGLLPEDAKRLFEEQEYWDRLQKMLADLETRYDYIVFHVQKRIDEVQEQIIEEVQAIDEQIEAKATDATQAEAMKAENERRTVLKWLLRRMDRHEEELQETDTAAEAVQLHQNIEQDIEDVKQGNVSPTRSVSRPAPFPKIADFLRGPKIEDETAFLNLSPETDEGKSGKGGKGGKDDKSGKSGKGGSGSGGSAAAGDEDDLPPPPVSPGGF